MSEEVRTTDMIATEIKDLFSVEAESHLEVGRLLLEAKEMLCEHGEWLGWLEKHVDMSPSKAQRLMRVAKWFPKETPVPHLEYSKLLLLTRLEKESISDFLATHHEVGGVEKSVENMSKRELEDAVHAYKALLSQETKAVKKRALKKVSLAKYVSKLKQNAAELPDLLKAVDPNDDLVTELRAICEEILLQTTSANDDQEATNS